MLLESEAVDICSIMYECSLWIQSTVRLSESSACHITLVAMTLHPSLSPFQTLSISWAASQRHLREISSQISVFHVRNHVHAKLTLVSLSPAMPDSTIGN